ncbi:MAG: extracellular solute-binding protein, partial [Bacillota bacterium]
MQKRRFLIALCILLVLSAAAFAEKITLWTWYDGSLGVIFRKLVQEEFVQKTGIEVEILTVPIADIVNKLLLAYIGGDAPDVVELYTNQVVDLGVRGALMDLTQFPDYQEVVSGLY